MKKVKNENTDSERKKFISTFVLFQTFFKGETFKLKVTPFEG
jgi:hypothetical protein